MKKKDRIALAVSALYTLLPLVVLVSRKSNALQVAILFVSPLIVYWGYRFVKGDISFIKSSGSDET